MSTQLAARTISARLGDYVHDLRYDDIPPGSVERLKFHLLHHFGLALSAHRQDDGQQAVRVTTALSPGGGGCSVIGSDVRAAAMDAAFANTTLMRADGWDDVLFPVGIHPALMTLPPALALAEEAKLSGRDLLTAISAGYDVMGKLGRSSWTWSAPVPRRSTNVFGSFGPATVTAKLLRLDRTQTMHTMSYAAHSAMGLAVGSLITHYYGMVVRNGMLGAVLAREGGVAVPDVLEGRFGFFDSFLGEVPADLDAALDSLGQTFEIDNATVKRYPGTALNIVPIDLMSMLMRAHHLTPDNVAAIEVELPEERANFDAGHSTGPFHSRVQASSSAAFQLAMVLTGALEIDQPYARLIERYDRAFASPEVDEIVGKTKVVLVQGRPIRYARVSVTTADGANVSSAGEGHELPWVDWMPWLVERSDGLVGDDRLRVLVGLVSELENVDDVSELLACLRPAGDGSSI
jgi:2-methylcitrate dehydratase PrpD